VRKRIVPRSGWYLFIVCVGAAACQTVSSAIPTPTVERTATTAVTPEATPEVTTYTPTWKEVEVKDVRLGIEIPPGWQAKQTNGGLLMAERFGTMEDGAAILGLQINLFVHALDNYQLPVSTDTNVAWAVLEQIITKKEYIGDAVVSEPTGFDWDGYDAAYYLLNDSNGNLSVLLAVAIPTPKRLVVSNFSAPAVQAPEIRDMLPEILSTLKINGVSLDTAALRALPDPLPFPNARPRSTPRP